MRRKGSKDKVVSNSKMVENSFAEKQLNNFQPEFDMTPKSPKVYIRTFGCQMNERDSEIIYSMMIQEGYTPVSSYEEADLIIFNTCSVRKHAEDRVWGKLKELKNLKHGESACSGAPPMIGLVGCMAKAHGKEVFKKLPHVSFICGPSNIYDIPGLAKKVKSGKSHLMSISKEKRPLSEKRDEYREEKIRAWVNISYGCNNFCSYCIVPFVRGREISRRSENIIDEIKRLVDNGAKEVTLLGQNVNSYKSPTGKSFIRLLEEVNRIDGLRRIRFMTSHPKDAGLELFKAIAGLDKVCEHLHLPLQSGSDRILRLMNRNYTSSHYLKLIDNLRKTIPDCAVTTDIIVGFPSETEGDFEDTRMLMEKIRFDSAFIFKYSPRPFAKASNTEDDILLEEKKERNQVLLGCQDKITRKKNEDLIGNVEEVLGISIAKRKPSSSEYPPATYIKGRSRKNSLVVYKGSMGLIGRILNVKIRGVEENTFIGEAV